MRCFAAGAYGTLSEHPSLPVLTRAISPLETTTAMILPYPRTRARRPLYRTALTPAAAAAAVLYLGGCSAPLDDEPDGPPRFNGTLGSTDANNPLVPSPTGNAPASNTAPNTPGPGGEQNPANNAPVNNTSSNINPSGGGGGATITGNASGGTGTGMNTGAAGMDTGAAGMDGTAQPPPVEQPPPVTPPPPPPPPPPPVFETECPAGAFFCTGFENGFPPGTANIAGGSAIPNPFVLDTNEVNSGSQSFHLPAGPNQAFLYRVLAIPAPGQQFWVRMFFRTDVAFGSSNSHEAIFGPSTGSLAQDNNNETRIELSEQFGYMLLHVRDGLREPAVRTRLAANEWHCLEARYDGDAGEVEIFANGQAFIDDQAALMQHDFQTFRLGYMKFNNTSRAVWFDDVVLAPDRIGCD